MSGEQHDEIDRARTRIIMPRSLFDPLILLLLTNTMIMTPSILSIC